MIYVSISTIPQRLNNINESIESLLRQTKKPDKIFVNIPFKYKRFSEKIEEDQIPKFNNKCVEIIGSPEDGSKLGLLDCVDGSKNQSFNYDSELLELRSKSDSRLCLDVGRASRKAGPFMARKLRMYYCNEVSEQYKRWLIVD